jgi:dipeptidyl aminopeptidase/acylaminoacyl peptidase
MRVASLIAALLLAAPATAQSVEKPAALVADGLPTVPTAMAAKTRAYMEFRTAAFQGWHPTDKSMLITTRFGNTAQVHRVAKAMGTRRQLSFEPEPVTNAGWAPTRGDVMVVQKDNGGDEFFQLYTLNNGQLSLLTDGKSRNQFNSWSRDGSLIGYSSTKRNGTDSDLYVMNPRDPKSARMVAEVKGGGWNIAAIAADGKTAIVANYIAVTNTDLFRLDLASGVLTPIGDITKDIAYGDVKLAPDGMLWVTSDEGSDFQRLGTLDPATGKFTPRAPAENWDVDGFDIAADGRFIAYVINEAGASRLKLLDPASGAARTVSALPTGVIGGLEIADWGDIGISLSSARSASDAFSIDPQSLAVTRWTESETGGLDAGRNSEPELVTVKSFDGLPVSGFLYRPDTTKFPGKRPMIINIHGGPEAQTRPGFLGRNNYLINELGIAIFFPNVRGSTGYGKAFVSRDNGPFKREDSVKDIGAFLGTLEKDKALDPTRFAVAGGSYGGYMCYASAIFYGPKFKSANCIVAISNFVTFLENTQSYRRDLRRVEYGDERDPKQRAKLMAISPLTRVKEISLPLFIVTGGNDPRVPASEADQIVKAVRANGGTAWHLLGQNEGHGFAKKENQDYQFWATLMFWEKTLLGTGGVSARDSTGKTGASTPHRLP